MECAVLGFSPSQTGHAEPIEGVIEPRWLNLGPGTSDELESLGEVMDRLGFITQTQFFLGYLHLSEPSSRARRGGGQSGQLLACLPRRPIPDKEICVGGLVGDLSEQREHLFVTGRL